MYYLRRGPSRVAQKRSGLPVSQGRWTELLGTSPALLRYYEYSQGVQIHVASWPAEFEMPDSVKVSWLYHEAGEASYGASQFMAIEGQFFVLVASQILAQENVAKNNLTGNPITKTPGGGFMISGPNGKPLCEPIEAGTEAILMADVDLRDIDYPKTFIDVVGH